MIRHRDINKIQAYIFMQRLYAYLLLLKYVQLLANYDNNGNLIQRRHKTTQLTTTYTYDYENRLIKINLPLGITAEYKYDPFGRRIEKNISNQITVKYLYDNEDIIMEYATVIPTNTTITTKYIHGPGIDEPLSMLRNNKTYYYHADALGSITRMTDQNGNTAQTIKYDSFGNIKSISNPFMIQPYAYTGREFDMESGFYYLRNRYYDPKTGRFITKDPIGFGGGINFYSYVNNRPTRFVDPWGLSGIVYDRSDGKIYITPSGAGIPLLQYPAGNNTTNPRGDPLTPDSHGPAPEGTFPMGDYIPTGNDINSSFGTGFIRIYLPSRAIPLKPRSGVGLHCGRANRGGPQALTEGCIRTTCEAMDYLQGDPPTTIDIVE